MLWDLWLAAVRRNYSQAITVVDESNGSYPAGSSTFFRHEPASRTTQRDEPGGPWCRYQLRMYGVGSYFVTACSRSVQVDPGFGEKGEEWSM